MTDSTSCFTENLILPKIIKLQKLPITQFPFPCTKLWTTYWDDINYVWKAVYYHQMTKIKLEKGKEAKDAYVEKEKMILQRGGIQSC